MIRKLKSGEYRLKPIKGEIWEPLTRGQQRKNMRKKFNILNSIKIYRIVTAPGAKVSP
jgi:hypothetical protein